jgi:steroid delta-isomerase-like uncharacterized protein
MSDELIGLGHESIEAFNTANWDRLAAAYTTDCVYEEPATQRRIEGIDAVLEVNKAWKAAIPDATGEITGEFACGDRGAFEVTWTGTQTGKLMIPGGGAILPTGRSLEVHAAQVCRVRDGKLAEVRHFFDLLGMLEQLGTVSAESFEGVAG